MKAIDLKWPEFKLDMQSIESWMRSNAGPHYLGNAAHAELRLLFSEDPSSDVKRLINEYWAELSSESDEAKAYKSLEDRKAEVAAAKASALAKLAALGLSDNEIKSLVGGA